MKKNKLIRGRWEEVVPAKGEFESKEQGGKIKRPFLYRNDAIYPYMDTVCARQLKTNYKKRYSVEKNQYI